MEGEYEEEQEHCKAWKESRKRSRTTVRSEGRREREEWVECKAWKNRREGKV
jgi:hypothetical protein